MRWACIAIMGLLILQSVAVGVGALFSLGSDRSALPLHDITEFDYLEPTAEQRDHFERCGAILHDRTSA